MPARHLRDVRRRMDIVGVDERPAERAARARCRRSSCREPDTPITTTIIRRRLSLATTRGRRSLRASSRAAAARSRERPWLEKRLISASGDHRRRHAELDRLERGPAAFARIGDHRRDAGERLVVLAGFRRRDRAATSAPRCRGATSRRAARRRCRAPCALRAARSPRRAPASSRTRCRCGSSWRSGPAPLGPQCSQPRSGVRREDLRERLEDLDRLSACRRASGSSRARARGRRPTRRHRCSAGPAATARARGASSPCSSCCRRRRWCRRRTRAARDRGSCPPPASPAGSISMMTRSPRGARTAPRGFRRIRCSLRPRCAARAASAWS